MTDERAAIDWTLLSHAYGAAGDVEGFLERARRGPLEDRVIAIEHLNACLVHQGTPCQASTFALPALLEILADDPPAKVATEILWIVATAASGMYTLYLAGEGRWQARKLRRQLAAALAADPYPQADTATIVAFEQALDGRVQDLLGEARARRALQAWAPRALEFMHHADPEVRIVVSMALGASDTRAPEILTGLLDLLAQESHDEVWSAILATLLDLEVDPRAIDDAITAGLEIEGRRTMSLVARIVLDGPKADDALVEALLRRGDDQWPEFTRSAGGRAGAKTAYGAALPQIGRRRGRRLLRKYEEIDDDAVDYDQLDYLAVELGLE